jgi:hypothetical protein
MNLPFMKTRCPFSRTSSQLPTPMGALECHAEADGKLEGEGLAVARCVHELTLG